MPYDLTANQHENLNLNDKEVFRSVYRRFLEPVCGFIFQCIGNREETEDIAAELMKKLWEKRADFKTLPNIKAFLYISARNMIVNHVRHAEVIKKADRELKHVMNAAEHPENNIANEQIKKIVLQKIYQAVETLPTQQRAIFKAIFFEELTTAAIAEKMKISTKTVNNQKQNALKAIREALDMKDLLWISLVMPVFQCFF